MPASFQALYAHPAMRALLRAETLALQPKLESLAGTHGLHLNVQADTPVPESCIVHWTRLHALETLWQGSLRAHIAEPLPFADDTFAAVLLSHVHQQAPDVAMLLREAARVIEPGGLLLLSGLYPLSAWTPWLWWQQRNMHPQLHLRTPFQLKRVLMASGVDVQLLRRFGPVMPRAGGGNAGDSELLGGGYVLIARKRRHAVTPIRVRHGRSKANVRATGSLAPGAHRECA